MEGNLQPSPVFRFITVQIYLAEYTQQLLQRVITLRKLL